MTHKWLEKLDQIKDKKFIFLEGSFNLDFIKLKDNYLLICIHADREIREYRLIHDRIQPELITQDMENFGLMLKQKSLTMGGIVLDSSIEKPIDITKLIINKL